MTALVHRLRRDVDMTGVSGIGTVADVLELPSGITLVRWRGAHPSTAIWPGGLADAMRVHGHHGTQIVPAGPLNPDLHGRAITLLDRRARAVVGLTDHLLKQLPPTTDTDPEGGSDS